MKDVQEPTPPRRAARLLGPAISALALACLAAAPAAGATLTATATADEIPYGAPLAVAGYAGEGQAPLAGVALQLQADPYPYRGFTVIARTQSAPDGSFGFSGIHPLQNTRVRVLAEGPARAISPPLQILVDPLVAIASARLGPGRNRLSVRIRHAAGLASPSVSAWWYLAPRGSRTFHLAAVTPTREIARGVTYAGAIVDPPAKRFSYRVCLNPLWEAAMGPPGAHGPCPHRGFRLANGT